MRFLCCFCRCASSEYSNGHEHLGLSLVIFFPPPLFFRFPLWAAVEAYKKYVVPLRWALPFGALFLLAAAIAPLLSGTTRALSAYHGLGKTMWTFQIIYTGTMHAGAFALEHCGEVGGGGRSCCGLR